jgi:phosphoribosyl 1,2-cyclic phosphodiesterase
LNKLHIISSGSKANAYIAESDGELILIDQGLSFKQFCFRCEELGINYRKIKAILVTHEHSDHIKGVFLTACKLDIPVYGTEKTIEMIKAKDKYCIDFAIFEKDSSFKVGNFSCTAFSTVHDAVDPVGYNITLNEKDVICFATDTGKVTTRMMSYISLCDHIILEANHDHAMLYKNTRYPADLKARIRGSKGHLSNDQCFEAIERIGVKCPKTIIFSHLSEDNNSPDILHSMALNFKNKNKLLFNCFVARQNEPFSLLLL